MQCPKLKDLCSSGGMTRQCSFYCSMARKKDHRNGEIYKGSFFFKLNIIQLGKMKNDLWGISEA